MNILRPQSIKTVPKLNFSAVNCSHLYAYRRFRTFQCNKNTLRYISHQYKLHAIENESSIEDDDANDDALSREFIEVGVVGPPHGVRGEFKVQPLTDFPEERLGAPGVRWLQAPTSKIGPSNSEPEQIELEWGRQSISKGREVWLVKIEEIDCPEDAALIRGHTILIPKTDRVPLDDDDEFYVQELVGLKVYMMENDTEQIGTVIDIFDGTGTHDVLKIQLLPSSLARNNTNDTSNNSTTSSTADTSSTDESSSFSYVLLPFAKPLVPFVDLPNNIMKITPPDGWLDLAVKSKQSEPRKEYMGKREKRSALGKKKGDKSSVKSDGDTNGGASVSLPVGGLSSGDVF